MVQVRWLIRDLDPDMTGDVDYARFFERLQKHEAARDKEKEGKKDGKKEGDKDKKQVRGEGVPAPHR